LVLPLLFSACIVNKILRIVRNHFLTYPSPPLYDHLDGIPGNVQAYSAKIFIMRNIFKKCPIIGVMGAGDNATGSATRHAYTLGQLIAQEGWVLLNGGRNCGVMDASARGAKEAGGLTVGILPDADMHRTSTYIDIPILTGLGSGRNNINVLSSDVVIACRGGAGTLSEIALALKAKKPVILVDFEIGEMFDQAEREHLIHVNTPAEAIEVVKRFLKRDT
jgi:uncharacterized protein (TIGR00725 family)